METKEYKRIINPKFKNSNGDILQLSKIIEVGKITKVKLKYLEKKQDSLGITSFFKKNKFQQEKILEVFDPNGIMFSFIVTFPNVTIRFRTKDAFTKLKDDFDDNYLKKSLLLSSMLPHYILKFHIGNLIELDWEYKKI